MILTAASVVLAAGAIVLIFVGQWLPASALLFVATVTALVGSHRTKTRREAEFRSRFHSVERIRETHDLSGFQRIREQAGELAAVRAVRKEFPGISLTDAVLLIRT
ncbi:hypothetical protein GCM10022251_55270 [Phytohabitans flavus]|uniref:Uncharacterized protein n=1 Tax=Phytohabitans flavus TaxID=1076124 RepID=A0A6F8XQ37_9ACTN|nr:hypothetical protein [Phytohabitans flavus]BCB75945.1 hypothetical protein Pflav_023550 [Phytohabitans flavus]